MSIRDRLRRILDQPLSESSWRDRDAGRKSGEVAGASGEPVKGRPPDPLGALLTPDELRTAETIVRLWSKTEQARRRLVSSYEAGRTGRTGTEPEMSDQDAEDHARLRRALRAMGPDGQAVIGRLVYDESGWPDAAIVAALRAASPIILGKGAE